MGLYISHQIGCGTICVFFAQRACCAGQIGRSLRSYSFHLLFCMDIIMAFPPHGLIKFMQPQKHDVIVADIPPEKQKTTHATIKGNGLNLQGMRQHNLQNRHNHAQAIGNHGHRPRDKRLAATRNPRTERPTSSWLCFRKLSSAKLIPPRLIRPRSGTPVLGRLLRRQLGQFRCSLHLPHPRHLHHRPGLALDPPASADGFAFP